MDKADIINKNMIVATSIAPFNIDNQRKAIDTWIKSGLEVVSFNCAEEYEILNKHFPDIRFEIVLRDGREKLGKPYVFFDDIMGYFKDCEYDVCGIINSDIYLVGFDKNRIYNEALDYLIFGSRVEISSLDNLNGEVCYGGYDYFFFYRELSSIYPKSELCIGQAVWDQWIVLVPIIDEIAVKEIMTPSAYHIKHSTRWGNDAAKEFVDMIFNIYGDRLGKFKCFIDNEAKLINFEKIFNKFAQKLIIRNRDKQERILVVFNGNHDSDTYKSIQNQSYNNFRIIDEKDLKLYQVKEELIYFIKEGSILDRNFLDLLMNYILDKEYAMCGIQVKNNYSIFVYTEFPFDLDNMAMKEYITDECIMYRTAFYKLCKEGKAKVEYNNGAFVGRGLVQTDYSNYMLSKKLSKCKDQKLCVFCAGGHTKKLLKEINFSEFEITAILDSNIKLDGTNIEGYKVYHKSRIHEVEFDYILISSLSYEEEIYKELLEYVSSDKIIRIYGSYIFREKHIT